MVDVALDAVQRAGIGTLDPDFGGLLDIKEVPPDVCRWGWQL